MASASVDFSTVTPEVLERAGVDPSDAQAAVANATGISIDAQNEVIGAARAVESGGITPGSLTSVVSAGFALAGQPEVGALLAIGQGLVQSLLTWLQPTQDCDWHVGDMCMQGAQPYGPKDPQWLTFDEWWKQNLQNNFLKQPPWNAIVPVAAEEAVIPGLSLIGDGPDPVPHTPQDTFWTLYKAAWRTNAELAINGRQWLDPYDVLQSLALHWNLTHAPYNGYPVQGTPGTYTFDSNGSSYINRLLAGQYRGQGTPPYALGRQAPITINTGALRASTQETKPVTVNVNPLVFSKTPTQTVEQAAANPGVQEAAYYAVHPAGTAEAYSPQAFARLKAAGIDTAQFGALNGAQQTVVRLAQIPIHAIGGDQAVFVSSAAAPSSGGISTGMIVGGVGVVAALGALAWMHFRSP